MTPAIILQQLRTLQAVNSVSLTISRGEQTCQLVAAPSQTKGQMVGNDGSLTKFVTKDWLIVQSDWTLTDPAEPQRGDVITVDASGKKYLVGHPDQRSPECVPHGDCEPLVGWVVHSVPE